MENQDQQGVFEVIDSFAIRSRNQFYLIGNLKEGNVEKNWFINVLLNPSLSLTIRITDIEDVEMHSEKEPKKLLIIESDNEQIGLLMGLNIGLEDLPITIEGID